MPVPYINSIISRDMREGSIASMIRTQRLVLRRRRQSPPHHQVVEERLDIGGAKLLGRLPRSVPLRGERQKLSNPQAIDVDGVLRQPPAAGHDLDLFEQFHDEMNIYLTQRRPVKMFSTK
jgi:hypothetical protein